MNKLVKTFTCETTGIKITYTYRTDSVTSGIEKSEIDYPKAYLDQFAKEQQRLDNLPKTKRLYLNPATGKEVSYARARALGLVK